MKEKLNSGEIRGLNREHFHFLVTETFLDRGLACPSAQQIDGAIQQTNDSMKKFLKTSFRLGNPQKIAAELGLSVLETQQLYYQALGKVVSLLEG